MSDPFLGLSFPAPGGPYASVDDLLLVDDLCQIDLRINRWKRNGAALCIRVRALDFEQQERIDRAALVKVDGTYVRSESRFAAGTLREACVVPTLTDAQARAMTKHNPQIISAIVRFVWDTLSSLDQDMIDAIVAAEVPGTAELAPDAPPDADRSDEPDDLSNAGEPYGFTAVTDQELVAA